MPKKTPIEETITDAPAPLQPEPVAYYTVVRGPIRVGKMILGKGHRNLRLTAAQAQTLGDHVLAEMPTV